MEGGATREISVSVPLNTWGITARHLYVALHVRTRAYVCARAPAIARMGISVLLVREQHAGPIVKTEDVVCSIPANVEADGPVNIARYLYVGPDVDMADNALGQTNADVDQITLVGIVRLLIIELRCCKGNHQRFGFTGIILTYSLFPCLLICFML
eukprot:XP_011450430.1 PREDICTED: uncharacterized protein LOC105344362 [Crassostrea gigas]